MISKATVFEWTTLAFAVLAVVFQSTVYSGLAIAFSLFAVESDWRQHAIFKLSTTTNKK